MNSSGGRLKKASVSGAENSGLIPSRIKIGIHSFLA